jgi:hypothetical protein
MFMHFMTILTVSTLGFVIRSLEGTEQMADVLHWVLRGLSPSYCLGSAVYLDASADLLTTSRASRGLELTDDDWALINVGGDIMCLVLHSILWTVILVVIETRKPKSSVTSKVSVPVFDESDVEQELKRVPSSTDVLKVDKFSKTYMIQASTGCLIKNKSAR